MSDYLKSSQKVVNTLNFVQKAKDDSRFSTHCRLYSGALSGTRTLGPLIKSHRFYAFPAIPRRIKQLRIVYFKEDCGETLPCAAWCAVVKK